MSEAQCEYCGEYFDKRGLGAHQAHCDAAKEEHSQPDYDDFFEAKLRERDGDECVSCGAQTGLTFHSIDPDAERELRNVVTLCKGCVDDVQGLHPRTKRTKIRSDNR